MAPSHLARVLSSAAIRASHWRSRWLTLALTIVVAGCGETPPPIAPMDVPRDMEPGDRPGDAHLDVMEPGDRPDDAHLDVIIDRAEAEVATSDSPVDVAAPTCADAPELTLGSRRTDSTALASHPIAGCAIAGESNPAVFYALTAPPRSAVAVVASSLVIVRLFSACDGSCIATNGPSPGGPTSGAPLVFRNDTEAPRRYVLAVTNGGAPGSTVSYMLSAYARTAPGGYACASPTPLTPGLPIRGETTALATELVTGCDEMARRPALFYRVTVPQGDTLNVTLTNGDGAPTMRLVSTCDATRCIAAADSGTLRYANTTGAPQSLVLAVAQDTFGPDAYDITATLQRTAPTALCTTAATLTETTPLREEASSSAVDAPPRCSTGSFAAEDRTLYYRVVAPARRSLAITATGDDPTQRAPGLALLRSCEPGACFATRDVAGSPAVNVSALRYVNGGSAPATITLAAVVRASALPFTLRATSAAFAANTSCAAAIPVVADGTAQVSLAAESPEVLPPCAGDARPSPPLYYYTASVPPGQTLTATLQPLTERSAPRETHLRVLAACGASTCLAQRTGDTITTPDTVVAYTNRGTSAAPVVVAAGMSTSAHVDGFRLFFRLLP